MICWLKGQTKDYQVYDASGIGDWFNFPPFTWTRVLQIIIEAVNAAAVKAYRWVLERIGWLANDKDESSQGQHLEKANGLFMASNGDKYVSYAEKQIHQWISETKKSEIEIGRNHECFGIFIDCNDVFYCSAGKVNKVINRSLRNPNSGWDTILDINNQQAQVNHPYGLFIDHNLDLYVADAGNDRILLLANGKPDKISIIGANVTINGTKLNFPTSVTLDAKKNLYIVDAKNHRIVFISSDLNVYRCLLACTGKGSEANQLSYPISMSFDNAGNILVTDTLNHRVQKFFLIEDSEIRDVTHGEQFIPLNCSNSSVIGGFCNISSDPCLVLNDPCGLFGNCIKDFNRSYGYSCSCHSNFTGVNCQNRKGRCQTHTCLNGGK